MMQIITEILWYFMKCPLSYDHYSRQRDINTCELRNYKVKVHTKQHVTAYLVNYQWTHSILAVVKLSDLQFVLSDANISCIISEDCVLPCSFRPTGPVVIHWYKQQIPVHSYYYNKDQFGLQNKHFSGRTSLFNSQIPHGNASLLLRRVKMQDKGRYKCYTSTRKGSQEIYVSLGVRG